MWTVGWGSLDLLPITREGKEGGKGVDSGVGFTGPAPNMGRVWTVGWGSLDLLPMTP